MEHDDEIHAATLSLRDWFHQQVLERIAFLDEVPVEEEAVTV